MRCAVCGRINEHCERCHAAHDWLQTVTVFGRPKTPLAVDPVALRKRRKERGWTQTEVAERVGVTFSAVWAWEAGRSVPTTDNQERWTKVLA